MKKTAVARFTVFVVIHTLLCFSAAVYAWEYTGGLQTVESPGSGIFIDGTDFSLLAELAVFSVNGLLSAFSAVITFAAMTVLSVVLLIPFRFIAVRKFTMITHAEQRATLVVILAGVALAVLAALIFGGIAAVPSCLLFLVPTLLIEILMYWLTLFFRARR